MLQTQISFIMTEADYIALSEDLRNTIHAINLLQENQEIGILYIFCTVLSILQGIWRQLRIFGIITHTHKFWLFTK